VYGALDGVFDVVLGGVRPGRLLFSMLLTGLVYVLEGFGNGFGNGFGVAKLKLILVGLHNVSLIKPRASGVLRRW
jgi:hypothetical protein